MSTTFTGYLHGVPEPEDEMFYPATDRRDLKRLVQSLICHGGRREPLCLKHLFFILIDWLDRRTGTGR